MEMDVARPRRGRARVDERRGRSGSSLPDGRWATASGSRSATTRTPSLFLGAALAATSVGITARVFSDLRALTSVEARTVLGAAVADDVLGLVILTVVVRIVTEGTVSVLDRAGHRRRRGRVPRADRVPRRASSARRCSAPCRQYSRSAGTLVALALAFTLFFAELADAAKLAPIIGAFVAGLSLSRSDQRERIERELTPVGHLFIPVFFLAIGIAVDVASFVKLEVLRGRRRARRRRDRRQAARRGRRDRLARATSRSSASACSPAVRSG